DCDQALLLEHRNNAFRCVASVPGSLTGLSWPKGALPQSGDGRILVSNGRNDGISLAGAISPAQPTLVIPIGAGGKPASLVLSRAEGRAAFSPDRLAIARQCAVLALTALAASCGDAREAEIQRLRGLLEKAERGEQSARIISRLLHDLID